MGFTLSYIFKSAQPFKGHEEKWLNGKVVIAHVHKNMHVFMTYGKKKNLYWFIAKIYTEGIWNKGIKRTKVIN